MTLYKARSKIETYLKWLKDNELDGDGVPDAIKTLLEHEASGGYARGYNDAKREIALSGEYERAYERGKADARAKGKWIEYTKVIIPEPYNHWEQAWKCSECGYGGQDDPSDETGWLEWKYCPRCGAEMEE